MGRNTCFEGSKMTTFGTFLEYQKEVFQTPKRGAQIKPRNGHKNASWGYPHEHFLDPKMGDFDPLNHVFRPFPRGTGNQYH